MKNQILIHRAVNFFKHRIKLSNKTDVHSFSLNSGERQVSETIEGIRNDHVVRYECAIDFLREMDLNLGLDIFCGTGYGSNILARSLNGNIIGIDGSEDSIDFANKYYSLPNTLFSYKRFPFSLPEKLFNFICCFESLEHVDDYNLFLDSMIKSIVPGGFIFISVPNSEIHSLNINPNPFHKNHFSFDEMTCELIKKRNLSMIKWYGQNIYLFDKKGKKQGILDSKNMILQENVIGENLVFLVQKKEY
jgi:2-polyprenyl-3-methyl-5-hydroxy-6-metoxy-1,4-benzoquinol methylase